MRRHSIGGVRKQNGRWYGLWYEGGVKKSRVLGLSSEMTKGEALRGGCKTRSGRQTEDSRRFEIRAVCRDDLLWLLQA